MQTHTLQCEIDHTRAREDGGIPVSLSSEYPVNRGSYQEVLVHTDAAVDLTRAPLPVIESHDTGKLNIGLVDNLRVVGKKLRGTLHMGKSARAREVLDDIHAGIVRSLSIGYQWMDSVQDGDTIRVTRWAPYELSLTAVPADPTIGINRTLSRGIEMKTEATNENTLVHEERLRVAEILAMGERSNMMDLAHAALKDGMSIEDFRMRALDEIDRRNDMETRRGPDKRTSLTPDPEAIPSQELANYSLSRAILAASGERSAIKAAGLELEVSQHLEKDMSRQVRGVLVPHEIMTRQVVKSGDGGNLVATEHLAGSFIDVLRDSSVVMRAGATTLNGLVGDVAIPRQTSSGAVGWFNLDATDTITEDNLGIDQVVLSLTSVAGIQSYSHVTLKQASPDIDNLIMTDLLGQIGLAIDNAAIEGSGVGAIPTGVTNTTGVNTQAVADTGGVPTWIEAVGFESAVAADNALMGSRAYITTSAIVGGMKTVAKDAGSGLFVMESGTVTGTVNGYPVYPTNHLSAGTLVFGNWADLILGFWGSLEILTDPYTSFAQGTVKVRAIQDVDVGVRHPESFCVGT